MKTSERIFETGSVVTPTYEQTNNMLIILLANHIYFNLFQSNSQPLQQEP